MAKRLTKQEPTPGRLPPQGHTREACRPLDDASDEKTAVQQVIELYAVPVNERWRLMARRRD